MVHVKPSLISTSFDCLVPRGKESVFAIFPRAGGELPIGFSANNVVSASYSMGHPQFC